MSQWRLVIEFEWPHTFPETIKREGREDQPKHMQDILFEMLEPLNRDNVLWHAARFELATDPDGSY